MPLRLALLGMWHAHADGMVRQLAAHPGEFTLVGCCESDPAVAEERRQRWSRLFPSLRVFESPEPLLAEELDGVIVEGRVFENVALARLAVESGRPVMLEKPGGMAMQPFRELLALASQRRLHVQMIYLFRYMTAVQEMFARAARGELGRIYEFRARIPKELATYQQFAEELRPYPGGLFFEMAGHVIDMLVRVIGAPHEVKSILAHHHTEAPASYIDNGVALFGCERAVGIIEVSALEVAPNSRRIEVYGTEGAFVIPHFGSGHLANNAIQEAQVCHAGESEWQTLRLPAATLQIADLREFAAVISGKKAPDFSATHDLAVQASLLRASGMWSD